MHSRLDREDLLLIAEALLEASADELERVFCEYRAMAALGAPFARLHGAYLFPDPVDQAGICAIRLIRNRPFPKGNSKIAYECMREMLIRSGYLWSRPMEDAEEIASVLNRLKSREISDAEFLRWVRSRVRPGLS